MKKLILKILKESIDVKEECITQNADILIDCADKIAFSLYNGGKVLLFGNGGSAADSQHIAAEFVNRFMLERPPLAAIALTTDTSIITSIGNDYSFDDIFSKQVVAIAKKEDIAIGISTSGNSKNVVNGIKAAKEIGLYTVGMTGKGGGALKKECDMLFAVNSRITARIQETHITIGHILCELVENKMFKGENYNANI
jgi:D-sedoheptulose 7-phosphate isomerase